jgi:hypothetical protein
MTPAENIYHSDVDMVDGLDPVIEQMEEYIAHGSVFQDEMDAYDDGQPDMDREYADLYGYGNEYDCVNDIFDYPEDWGV